jgi:predicted DNA-binding transcriptional regulator AlpA
MEDRTLLDIAIDRMTSDLRCLISEEFAKLKSELSELQLKSATVNPETSVAVSSESQREASKLRADLLNNRMTSEGNLLIDVDALATLLNISRRTLSRLVAEQSIPAPIRFGTLNRWNLKDIITWVDSGCQRIGSPWSSGRRQRRPSRGK